MSDVDDFIEFASASEQRFYRHAYLLCHDREQARDLVQTTLLKLYKAWRRVRRAENMHAYAHKTLVRSYLDTQRRSRRERDLNELPGPSAAPDRPDLRMTVLDALATLPPRAKAVVVLRYWEDYSIAQTAEALDCSPGTVKAQSTRALALLRTHLGDTFLELVDN